MSFGTISGYIKTQPVLILLSVTAVVYFKSLFNGYALDDELYALSPSLTELSWDQFLKIFSSATFNDKGDAGYDYRPLALSSFFIEYVIFGKHVFISHAINLILYLLVLIQFYRILIRSGLDKNVVLTAMLLFALHPVHTEVVCNLKCRDELLAFAFALVSFRVAIDYFQRGKIIYLPGVFLFFLASFLSKQTTASFVIIIPVSLALCFGFDGKKVFSVFLVLVASGFIFLLIKKQAIPFNTRSFVFYENPIAPGRNFLLKSSTGLAVAYRYLKLLLVPSPLAYYYGYKYVDAAYFSDPAVILSAFVHLALALLLIKNFKTNSQFAIGLLFYLANIFVFTFFIRKIPGLMGERFLFGASLGFCIILSLMIRKVALFFGTKKSLFANSAVMSMLMVYALLSFNRSKVWKDKETLYSNDMKTLEGSAKANLLYGSLLSEQALKERNKEKMERAIYHLKKTTIIVPNYSLAWENLGVLYYFNGDINNALACLDTAIVKDSLSGKAYFDKAVIYESMHQFVVAEKFYLLSLTKDPAYIPCYLKLMSLFEKQGHHHKALAVGKIGATWEKRTDLIYSEMIRLSLLNKDTLGAIRFSEKAVAVNPKNTARAQTLENYFRSKGNSPKADFYRRLWQEEKRDK